MPKLGRSQWYDLSRDNWHFKYVKDEDVFPEALSYSHSIPSIPTDAWWSWDELEGEI